MQNDNQYICKYTILNNCTDNDIKNIIDDNITSCLEEISLQLPENNINTIFNINDITKNKLYSLSNNLNEAKRCSMILNYAIKELTNVIKEELNVDFLISGELHIFHTTEITDYNNIENNDLVSIEQEKYVLNSKGFINQNTNEKIDPDIILNDDKEKNEEDFNLEELVETQIKKAEAQNIEMNKPNQTQNRQARFQRLSNRTKNSEEHNDVT